LSLYITFGPSAVLVFRHTSAGVEADPIVIGMKLNSFIGIYLSSLNRRR